MFRILSIILIFSYCLTSLLCDVSKSELPFHRHFSQLQHDRSGIIDDDQIISFLNRDRELILMEAIIYEWVGSNWSRVVKEEYYYNEDGLMDEVKVFYWNMGFWAASSRYYLSYQEGENISEIIIQVRIQGEWENYLRLSFSYENGNSIEDLTQNWTNDSWVNASRSLNYYSEDLFVQQVDQSWYANYWQETDQYWYTYDNSDYLVEILQEQWLASQWIENYLNIIGNDENGNPLNNLGQYYFNGSWLNDENSIYDYDEDDNLITDLYQFWYLEEWFDQQLTTYTYDDEGNPLEYIIQLLEAEEWENSQRVEYIYEEVGADENNLPANDLIRLYNYPNPFNPSTTISFNLTENTENTGLVIYNIEGQKVKSFEIAQRGNEGIYKVSWDGTDDSNNPVTSGIYFYKLNTGDQEYVKKMILIK